MTEKLSQCKIGDRVRRDSIRTREPKPLFEREDLPQVWDDEFVGRRGSWAPPQVVRKVRVAAVAANNDERDGAADETR